MQQSRAISSNPGPAVFSVAITSFSLVSSEFLPVGMLNAISTDIGVSTGTAGLLISVPGLIAAAAALLLTVLAGRHDRRKLLLWLTVMLLASNVAMSLTQDWWFMLVARVLLGVVLGGFWSLGVSSISGIVPASQAARATSIIYAGISVGIVLGVPVGTLVGQMYGWRAAFGISAALSLVSFILQYVTLPKMPVASAARFEDFLALIKINSVQWAIFIILMSGGAQYATYTFLEPFLREVVIVNDKSITLALLIYGGAGLIGSFLGGYTITKSLPGTLVSVLLCIAFALGLLYFLHSSVPGAFLAIFIWGVAFGAMPLCLQIWKMRLVHPQTDAGSSLFVTCFQSSIAAGAAIGGLTVNSFGIGEIMKWGALAFVVTGLITVYATKMRSAKPSAEQHQ